MLVYLTEVVSTSNGDVLYSRLINTDFIVIAKKDDESNNRSRIFLHGRPYTIIVTETLDDIYSLSHEKH